MTVSAQLHFLLLSFYGQMLHQQLLATHFILEHDWQPVEMNWTKKRSTLLLLISKIMKIMNIAEKKIN